MMKRRKIRQGPDVCPVLHYGTFIAILPSGLKRPILQEATVAPETWQGPRAVKLDQDFLPVLLLLPALPGPLQGSFPGRTQSQSP